MKEASFLLSLLLQTLISLASLLSVLITTAVERLNFEAYRAVSTFVILDYIYLYNNRVRAWFPFKQMSDGGLAWESGRRTGH